MFTTCTRLILTQLFIFIYLYKIILFNFIFDFSNLSMTKNAIIILCSERSAHVLYYETIIILSDNFLNRRGPG